MNKRGAKRAAYLKQYHEKNKERHSEYRRQYRKAHKEQENEWARRSYRRTADAWKEGITITQEIVKKAESLGPSILEKEGFSDIIQIHGNSVFDYYARKDGGICGIDVTTAVKKELRKQHRQMARYFNLKIFLLFVKPDFTLYHLVEIPLGLKSYSHHRMYNHLDEMKKLEAN